MLGCLVQASAGGPLDLQTCAAQSVCHPVLSSKTRPDPPGRIGLSSRGAAFSIIVEYEDWPTELLLLIKALGHSISGGLSVGHFVVSFVVGSWAGWFSIEVLSAFSLEKKRWSVVVEACCWEVVMWCM